MKSLSDITRDLVNDQNQKLERWLVSIFGSYENAQKMADDYVLEVQDSDMSALDDWNVKDSYKITVQTRYRLRPKTEEEKLKERADRIIERNTRVFPKCISCLQPITPEQPHVITIHGDYHGRPMSCMDGRLDYR